MSSNPLVGQWPVTSISDKNGSIMAQGGSLRVEKGFQGVSRTSRQKRTGTQWGAPCDKKKG
jgi:hypothetical protein